MYLHLGRDTLIKTRDLIGIFDLDNTTVAKATRGFLEKAEKSGRVVTVADDLPKTFVLWGRNRRECRIYLSQISTSTLRKRTRRGAEW